MRVGVSISSTHVHDDQRVGARHMIERARVAHEVGLDSLSLGDHHAMPVPYYQGVPMLGRLLAEWTSDRPVGCLFLLPLWNPVLVAEHVGTLANLTDAPFVIQTGIGWGAPQFAAMGADITQRGRTIDESIRVVKGLLAGDKMSSDFLGVHDARVNPRPPGPLEWWIGGGAPVALQRAAREGDAWYAGPDVTSETVADRAQPYLETCRAAGKDSRICVRKDVIVLQDADRARRLGDRLIEEGYRGMRRESVVYGGVADAVEHLAPYAEAGIDDVIVRCMAVDQADALETLERCGEVRAALT